MPADSQPKLKTVARRGGVPGAYARSREVDRNYLRRKGVPPRRANHMETGSHVYRCKTCGEEFTTPELLGAHWRAEHPAIFSDDWYQRPWRRRKEKTMSDGPATCPKCGKEFKSRKGLGPHLRYCGREKPSKGVKTTRKMSARRRLEHRRRSHDRRPTQRHLNNRIAAYRPLSSAFSV